MALGRQSSPGEVICGGNSKGMSYLYNVRPGEMKMWSQNGGGLLIEVVALAGLTVFVSDSPVHPLGTRQK